MAKSRNWKKEYAARKEYLKAYRKKNKDKDNKEKELKQYVQKEVVKSLVST